MSKKVDWYGNNDTYTRDHTSVECPYCHKINRLDSEDVSWEEDKGDEIQCQECDKEFYLQVNVMWSWSAYPYIEQPPTTGGTND